LKISLNQHFISSVAIIIIQLCLVRYNHSSTLTSATHDDEKKGQIVIYVHYIFNN